MKAIEKALRELRASVLGMILAQRLVDCLVAFLLVFMITVLTNISWLFSFIPAGIYLIAHLYNGFREAKLAEVEAKVPEMQMQLRTVADNVNIDNPVVRELQEDVLERMRRVKMSAFVHFGRMGLRVITLIALSFAIIFVSAADVQFIDLPKTIEAVKNSQLRSAYNINESLLEILENESEYKYGNRSVAELGYEELQLKITPVQNEVEIGKVLPPEEKRFQESRAQVGKPQKTGGAYQESEKVKQNYKLVQKYFTGISKSD
ncbi:hypothetical protein HY486_00535 [Candidatus Woesearchaeota archaeon]|nr:hypothetical protein [Candidatus Woesearchaeota archaeon]